MSTMMTVMEEGPELDVRSASEAELRVERTDITFHDVAPDRVRIQVAVHNVGGQRSAPTLMTLESAPLGAFVPWQPLTRLPVPALEPGESRVIRTEVTRPRPAAPGSFGGVPPNRLLTAISSPDEPAPEPPAPQPAQGIIGLLNLFRGRQQPRTAPADAAGGATLAPDLWDLAGRGRPHWAGNINVFIGHHSVERHLARALRIYPGRTNLALFMVGGRGRDAFSFELVGRTPEWPAELRGSAGGRAGVIDPRGNSIEEGRWVESDGGLVVFLATHPPEGSTTGNLEVHVTRRSCGKEAIVEFDLDAGAQGAGCYVV